MKTFEEMIGPDLGRNIDREINAILGQFHRNIEQLCKEEFDRFAVANGYIRADSVSTYDPSTHVCVSRKTAITALAMLSGDGAVLSFDRDDAETELRAALEVGK